MSLNRLLVNRNHTHQLIVCCSKAAEREASGEDDATLDGVAAACVAGPGGTLFVPHADHPK